MKYKSKSGHKYSRLVVQYKCRGTKGKSDYFGNRDLVIIEAKVFQ